jgi:D-alanyl-D-alanine carboxypeptidase/D-alanyl-D-alanine-endopeptidase (penicillin-binding protein 4)
MRFRIFIFLIGWPIIFFSCSVQKKAIIPDYEGLLRDSSTLSAHIGISVYDATDNKTLQEFQAGKYFTPASNTKLFSLYAGLKYLGDSLEGMRYQEDDTAIYLYPTGDPTLLHPDYTDQPVIDWLKQVKKKIYLFDKIWKENALGRGWGWDDYNDDYMPERSPLPVFGNLVTWEQTRLNDGTLQVLPKPQANWNIQLNIDSPLKRFTVRRDLSENRFSIQTSGEKQRIVQVPFVTHGAETAMKLLSDSLAINIIPGRNFPPESNYHSIKSRPSDSMYRPMMHRSDNFFAEQTLLMVSNRVLGLMNDERIIDTLLKTDLTGLPQKPSWVDGCGLSRSDLFTPMDFIWILNRLKDEFGIDRMKRLLATGGEGTLGSRYKQDSGYLYAKTGSLGGVAALSGYLYTDNKHLLLFSILVNNYNGSGSAVRDAMARYVDMLRAKY